MSEASAPRSKRRILVAIDTSPLAPLAVELAAQTSKKPSIFSLTPPIA